MIGELAELVDWCRAATAGWRFAFSPAYRQRTLEGWRAERWYYIAGDVICGLAGVAFSLIPLGLLVIVLKEAFTK